MLAMIPRCTATAQENVSRTSDNYVTADSPFLQNVISVILCVLAFLFLYSPPACLDASIRCSYVLQFYWGKSGPGWAGRVGKFKPFQ